MILYPVFLYGNYNDFAGTKSEKKEESPKKPGQWSHCEIS